MIIVSSCLAGINSRYDGKNSEDERIVELVKEGQAIPLCPEQLGGLPTPRSCCEISTGKGGERIIHTRDGRDLTPYFTEGAQKTLAVAKALEVEYVILKSRSPSCGCGGIYDGTFSGKLVGGNGVTAQLLLDHDFTVYREDEIIGIVKEKK